MSAKNIKTIAAAIAIAGIVPAANAGFVSVDSVVPAASSTINIVPQNDFKSILHGVGVDTYTLGASLAVDSYGSVTYYYFGKEAGYNNSFTAGGLSTFYTGYTPNAQNLFGSGGYNLGTVSVGPGLLNFNFCAYSSPGVQVGRCVSNANNDAFSMGSFQSIAFNATGNVAWLFWDDSGAGPDDNHDDMLIKAVFNPRSVPEPATLGLFGLGLLGTWFAARRRKQARSAI